MNSKVNFHGQEIDLEQLKSYETNSLCTGEYCLTIAIRKEYGTCRFMFHAPSYNEAKQLHDEFRSIVVKYHEYNALVKAITQQENCVKELRERYEFELAKLHRMIKEKLKK